MFRGSQRLPFKSIKLFLQNYNQEWLFLKYTGIYPEINKRYHSIFRQDKTPSCRFEWRLGVLYFIDNAGYNGVTHFDVVGTVCRLFNVTIPKAINMIENENVPQSNITYSTSSKTPKEIRFTYQKWPDNNYFKIQPDHLLNENVYWVKDYWIKKDDSWLYNNIHNPRNVLTIAYYFPDTKSTKLYWPTASDFKWYSTCTDEVYGESKLDYYLENDPRLLVITKSQKDRLVLDYLCGIPAIAFQSESIIPSTKIINKCKQFNKTIILYDNDYPGQMCAGKLSELTGFDWCCYEMGKDSYDNINNLNYIKNILCN